jgi:hypothetical protein
MKRTLIVIALIAALVAPVWAQNFSRTSDGFEWYKVGNGIVITGYNGTATAVRIPDRIDNLPVVEIENGAFQPGSSEGNTFGITSVVIPNTVTRIGESAFRSQSNLTSVTLPTSLIEIGATAFRSCSALTSISLPASIRTIGLSAFNGCTALTTVTIPASVTRITFGANAFQGVTNLNAVSVATLQRVGYVF